MKTSELKKQLSNVKELNFLLPNGSTIPKHFHITEMGLTTKHFIDCGNTIHVDKTANLQIWVANDTDHRLSPEGLLKIISVSESLLGNEDIEMEIEFQTETVGKYGLEFSAGNFILTAKQTDCLAKENCGVPKEKIKTNLSELATAQSSCCTPGGGCC